MSKKIIFALLASLMLVGCSSKKAETVTTISEKELVEQEVVSEIPEVTSEIDGEMRTVSYSGISFDLPVSYKDDEMFDFIWTGHDGNVELHMFPTPSADYPAAEPVSARWYLEDKHDNTIEACSYIKSHDKTRDEDYVTFVSLYIEALNAEEIYAGIVNSTDFSNASFEFDEDRWKSYDSEIEKRPHLAFNDTVDVSNILKAPSETPSEYDIAVPVVVDFSYGDLRESLTSLHSTPVKQSNHVDAFGLSFDVEPTYNSIQLFLSDLSMEVSVLNRKTLQYVSAELINYSALGYGEPLDVVYSYDEFTSDSFEFPIDDHGDCQIYLRNNDGKIYELYVSTLGNDMKADSELLRSVLDSLSINIDFDWNAELSKIEEDIKSKKIKEDF